MADKELYYAREKARLCVRCGALLDGDDGVLCKSCVAKWRKRRAERKESRICTACGRPFEEDDKGTMCKKCKARERRRKRAKMQERIQAGLCTKCGQRPPREGKTMCQECSAKKAEYRKHYSAKMKAKEEK